MGKILGIDYGEVRIGVSVSNSTNMIAFQVGFIDARKTEPISEIENIFNEKQCDRIVLGLPLNMKGEDTEKTKEVRSFAKQIEDRLNIKVIFWDERFTTKAAHDIMHEQGKKPGKNKGKVDAIAAQLILQGYLDSI